MPHAEPFAFARRATDVQHVEHAAAHIAQPISETLGAICRGRRRFRRYAPEKHPHHVHQAKGAREDDWKPEEDANFAVVRIFGLAKHAAELHNLQIQLRDRCDVDVLSDAIGKRGIYAVDDPDDLQCREEWDRGQETSLATCFGPHQSADGNGCNDRQNHRKRPNQAGDAALLALVVKYEVAFSASGASIASIAGRATGIAGIGIGTANSARACLCARTRQR